MQRLHSIVDALTLCYSLNPRAHNIAEADVEAAELHSLHSRSICVCMCAQTTSAHLYHVNCARRSVRLRMHAG